MYDDANPDKTTSTNLTITVNRNANAPRFQNSNIRATVLEIVPVGSSIATVRATDRDQVIYIYLLITSYLCQYYTQK